MATPEDDGATWQAAFLDQARPLVARWRRHRVRVRLLITAWVPLVLLLVGVFIQRWTLLDWPGQWVLILGAVPVWLVVLGIAWLVERPAPGVLARAGDAILGLDERLATAYEFARQPLPEAPSAAILVRRQRLNALASLNDVREEMATAFPVTPRRYRPALAVAGGLVALVLAVGFLPSPYTPLRAERDALRATVLQQAADLEQTRRDVVARPQLPPDLSRLLDQQLHTATDRLLQAPDDRGSAVAALSQAEARLRQDLPPDAEQQAAAVAAAAPLIRSALPSANRVSDPPENLSDLGKAAYDAAQLADTLGDVLFGTSNQTSDAPTVSRNLEQAAAALDSVDPALAAQLRAAAAAISKGDSQAAQDALHAAATALGALDIREAANAALSQAVDQLDQARTTVAQAGLPPVANNTPDNRLGSLSQPAGSGAPPSSAGTTSSGTASTGGAGSPAQPGQGSNPGAGNGTPQARSGDPSNDGSLGGQNAGPSTTGGGGPGTRNGSANQGGTGAGAAPTPGGTSGTSTGGTGPDDKVYVPQPPNQLAENDQGLQDNIPGQVRGNAGDTGAQDYRGAGVNPGVHTPYQDVIGQYSDSAASALDRTALPPDAKQYVRDYFSSLEP